LTCLLHTSDPSEHLREQWQAIEEQENKQQIQIPKPQTQPVIAEFFKKCNAVKWNKKYPQSLK